MSDIPTAREKLSALVDELAAAGNTAAASKIRSEILPLMTRRQHTRRGRNRSRVLTDTLRREIRSFANSEEGAHYHVQEIATRFGVNIGRVSEILHELR